MKKHTKPKRKPHNGDVDFGLARYFRGGRWHKMKQVGPKTWTMNYAVPAAPPRRPKKKKLITRAFATLLERKYALMTSLIAKDPRP